MIRIAICDDEKIVSENVRQLIDGYLRTKAKNYTIECCQSGEKLLEMNLAQVDVFFLDVEMREGMDGIELAKKIRLKNLRADIIFTSSHPEKAYCAFEVNALRYLLKPVQKETIYKTMDLVIRRRKERESKLLKLNQGQKYLQLQLAEIIYFETLDRKLKVHTTQKVYMVDNKINELDKILEDRSFFRIHKSYLVNLAFVKEHDQSTVTMQNGEEVYLSRLRIKAFKESYKMYLREA